MHKNVFDTKNTDDLPDVIKKSLRKPKEGKSDHKIVELLKLAKGSLSVDEIMVGYYRLHKEIKTRRQIIAIIYRMCKDPRSKIVRLKGKSGVYRFVKTQGVER